MGSLRRALSKDRITRVAITTLLFSHLTFFEISTASANTLQAACIIGSETANCQAYSPQEIQNLYGTGGSSTQYISVNGTRTQVWALLDSTNSDGGGWILLMKGARGTSNFGYANTSPSKPYFTSTDLLNETSQLNGNLGDAKFGVYNSLQVKKLLAVFKDPTSGSLSNQGDILNNAFGGHVWLETLPTAQTAKTTLETTRQISDGSANTRYSLYRESNSNSATPVFSYQTGLVKYGFNLNTGCAGKKVRWGIVFNNEADTNSCDAYVGIGLESNSPGDHTTWVGTDNYAGRKGETAFQIWGKMSDPDLAAPRNLSVTQTNGNTFNASWQPPVSGSVDEYILQYKLSSASNWNNATTHRVTSPTSSPSVSISSVSSGTYDFRVWSRNTSSRNSSAQSVAVSNILLDPAICAPSTTTSGDITIVQFKAPVQTTSCASSWTAPAGINRVQALLVGGGGSGAYYYGGGGGGGGVTTGFYSVTPGSSYNLNVGGGGARIEGTSALGFTPITGNNGSSTTITIGGSTYSAPGGFGGVGCTNLTYNPVSCNRTNLGGAAGNANGGSGGIGAYHINNFTSGEWGPAGLTSSISGTSVVYASGGRGAQDNVVYNDSGTDNTGNGGSGARARDSGVNVFTGAGAAGILIIRYKTTPPVITGPNSATGATSSKSIAETSTAVHTFTASEAVTWTLGGTDASFFAINETGTLTISLRDFETPADSNTNNTYIVEVTGTDGFGGSATQTLTVSITNVNEAPVITTNSSSATYALTQTENVSAVATFAATDVDTGTTLAWSISGTDFADFSINSSTGVLTFASNPNFEGAADSDTNNIYTVIVTVSDAQLTDSQTVTVTITDINEAPVISTNSSNATYPISQTEATAIGIPYAGTDQDTGTVLTWSKSGTDAALFNINSSTGALTFATTPNFEGPTDSDGNNTYIVTITLSDGTLSDSQTATITITNTNEAPVITTNSSNATYAITQAEGISAVATFAGTDVDTPTTLTWSISGTDAADFTLNTSTGVLAFASTPNFEGAADSDTNNVYSVVITLNDGALTDTQTVTITVTDINEAPVISTDSSNATSAVSQAEASATGVAFAGTDQDSGTVLTWSKSGTDAALFNVDSSTGALTFANTPNFETPSDSDGNNTYIVTVTLSDGTLTDSQTVTITILNTNEGPVITTNSSAATYALNNPEGQLSVTTFTGSDIDTGTTLSWSITGIDSATLSINSSTGALTFKAAPDFEAAIDNGANNTYIVVVTLFDGSLTDTQTVTITITDVNDAPTITTNSSNSTYAISVAETATVITTFTGNDVDAGSTKTWSISGTDAADLIMNPSTGVLSFISTPNYEDPSDSDLNNTYIVVVTLSDGTLTDIQTVTITVTNVNEAPRISTNSSEPTYSLSKKERQTAVNTFFGTDPDAGASLTWSISGTDSATLSINSSTGALSFKASPNYSAPTDSDRNNTYIVVVALSDGLLSDTQTVTITITDVNEAPVITINSSAVSHKITQNEGLTAVITYTGTDTDTGTVLSWSLSGTDADDFIIDSATGVLTFVSPPDYESPTDSNSDNTYVVIVTLSDGTATDTQVLSVTIMNIDDLAAVFDGSTYLTTSSGTSLNRLNNYRYTVAAWVNPTADCSTVGRVCNVINKPNQYRMWTLGGTYTNQFGFQTNGIQVLFRLEGYSQTFSNSSGVIAAGIILPPNSWSHIMVQGNINSYGKSVVSFFYNGEPVVVYNIGDGVLPSQVSGSEPLTIGGIQGAPNDNFIGLIDQVQITYGAEAINFEGNIPINGPSILPYSYQPLIGADATVGNYFRAHYDFNEESGATFFNRAPGADSATNLTAVTGTVGRSLVPEVIVTAQDTKIVFTRTHLTSSGGWKVPTGSTKAKVLIVGGGGAGGASYGGGGGAGAFIETTTTLSSSMIVIVGTGGAPLTNQSQLELTSGKESRFGNLRLNGGGAGSFKRFGVSSQGCTPGSTGGSGGGGRGAGIIGTVNTGCGNGYEPGGGGINKLTGSKGKIGGNGAYGQGGGGGGAGPDYTDGTSLNAISTPGGRGGIGSMGLYSTIHGGCYATGGGGGGSSRAGGGCTNSTPPLWLSLSTANGNSSGSLKGGDATNGTGSGGGAAENANGALGYGGAGGSGIVVVQLVTMPNFGEPAPVETVTAGVVHRFNFATSPTPGVTRSFYWEHTNGVANTWAPLGNTSSFYDFKSPGSDYLETTTSGSAYSFRVTITDTDSNGLASTRTSSPFYVVVNPRNQVVLSSYSYNETTTAPNLALTTIAAGSAPTHSYTFASKYGDTLTAVMSFGYGTDSRTATVEASGPNTLGTIEWSDASSSGITLRVKPTLLPGTYYETLTVTDNAGAFTNLALRINHSRADTITVVSQISSQTSFTMNYNGNPAPTAIRTVSGLKNADTLTALSTIDTRTGNSLIYQAANCASGGECSVGDLAPGGGRVFYVSSTPLVSIGGISAGGIYLATAPNLIGLRTWCSSTSVGASALSTTVGAGAFNTSILASNCSASSNAARSVSEIYDINGYDDWFLPTTEELALIKSQLVDTSRQSISGDLWSSSTNGITDARSYSMSTGTVSTTSFSLAVTTEKNVMPIRAFNQKIIDIYNPPTDAGSYSAIAQIEMASPGTFTNYQGIEYTNATLTINRAQQQPLTIGQFGAFVGESYPLNVFGGTGPGILVRSLVSAGTASCSYDSATFRITATAAGTCSVQVIKAGTPNYLTESTTATIFWTKFVAFVAGATNTGSIPLAADTTITKRTEVVSSSSFLDASNQPIVGAVSRGATIRIVISGFEGLTPDDLTVYFKPYEDATVVTVTSTYVEVVVPAGAITGRIAIDGPRGVAYSPSLSINP